MINVNQAQIVTVINKGITRLGRVIGNDYNVGITIVAKNNPNDFLYCYNGPLSPQVSNKYSWGEKDIIAYENINNRIKKGIVNIDDFFDFLHTLGIHTTGGTSAETCAFGA